MFRGGFYSCRRAIREGWFSRTGAGEARPVEVLYDDEAGYKEAIYIDSEEYHEDGLCHLLQGLPPSEEAAFYQEQLRKLQEERKQWLNGK